MKVKITKLGYLNHERQREGKILDVKESEFSDKWMEKVDGRKKAKLEEVEEEVI